jgi:hypothetical protein
MVLQRMSLRAHITMWWPDASHDPTGDRAIDGKA